MNSVSFLIGKLEIRHALPLRHYLCGRGRIQHALQRGQSGRLHRLRFKICSRGGLEVVRVQYMVALNDGEANRRSRLYRRQHPGIAHREGHFHGIHVSRDRLTGDD